MCVAGVATLRATGDILWSLYEENMTALGFRATLMIDLGWEKCCTEALF